MKYLLIAVVILFTSCEETKNIINPRQFHIQASKQGEYELRVISDKYNILIDNDHPIDGFNVKIGEIVTVKVVNADNLPVFIAGDIGETLDGEYIFNSGETWKFKIE